jgi:hypothetical protein
LYGDAGKPPETHGDDLLLGSGDDVRRTVDATKEAVANLRAIPLPDENHADAERLIEIMALSASGLEEAAPRIEEASRRLHQAIESIDPEDLPPAPKEPTTVAEESWRS